MPYASSSGCAAVQWGARGRPSDDPISGCHAWSVSPPSLIAVVIGHRTAVTGPGRCLSSAVPSSKWSRCSSSQSSSPWSKPETSSPSPWTHPSQAGDRSGGSRRIVPGPAGAQYGEAWRPGRLLTGADPVRRRSRRTSPPANELAGGSCVLARFRSRRSRSLRRLCGPRSRPPSRGAFGSPAAMHVRGSGRPRRRCSAAPP